MGSCISKCSSATKNCNIPIQDKIIIMPQHYSLISLPAIPTSKINPLSPSIFSSTTTTTTKTTSTTIYNSSTAAITSNYSSSSLKRGSFSNEFLWSSIKENPKIIQQIEVISPTKKAPKKSPVSTSQAQKSRSAIAAPSKQSVPGCTQLEQPKKARWNSPSPARQRSFRKEPERQMPISLQRQNSGSQSPNRRFDRRGLSPISPSRRLNGFAIKDNILLKNLQGATQKCGVVGRKFDGGYSYKSGVDQFARSASVKLAAGKENCPHRARDYELRTELQVIDQNVVGEMVSKYHDSKSSVSMEDIDNPLISLDCFIFL